MELDFESNNKFTKAHFDFNNLPQLTNPWRQLNLQGVALGLIRLLRAMVTHLLTATQNKKKFIL